jgi:hypothetical protein
MSDELETITDEGLRLLVHSLMQQRNSLQSEQDEMFTLMAALIASAGGEITLTPEALSRNYEIIRTENIESLTTMFRAKEI